jgi:hypothetical protein
VIYFYSKTNEMHQFLKFILFCSSTLHVSDGLSVHYQESADCLLASSQQNMCDKPDAVYTVLDS